MNQGRIIVITGSPGTGKTTTASIVAKESNRSWAASPQRGSWQSQRRGSVASYG